MLTERIDQDLKAALLGGDKAKVDALRNLKNAIQYAAVEKRTKDGKPLTNDEIEAVLAKEAKKRQEAADLYKQAGQQVRADAELAEKAMISTYLPKALSAEELKSIVNEVLASTGKDPALKGRIIGEVKQKVGNQAEGAEIARLVSEALGS